MLETTDLIKGDISVVRVDNAPGFQSLKEDKVLCDAGITLEFGRVKNKNKNAVADKCIQEVESTLLKVIGSYRPIQPRELDRVLSIVNKHVRNSGLSSRELLFQRDQYSGQQIPFTDKAMSDRQMALREQNHPSSEYTKARGGALATHADVSIGDLVYIKKEGDKFNARDIYIIINVKDTLAILQKMVNNKMSSRKYEVPLNEIYRAVPKSRFVFDWDDHQPHGSDDDSDGDYTHNQQHKETEEDHHSGREGDEDGGEAAEDSTVAPANDTSQSLNTQSDLPLSVHPTRTRNPPLRFGDEHLKYYGPPK